MSPDPVDNAPGSTGPVESALRDALAAYDVPPMLNPLAIEACRTAQRLDKFDRQLDGHDWLRFHANDDETEVTVYIDKVVSEARETGVAFRGMLSDLVKGLPKPEQEKKGGGKLASVTAILEARRPTTG